MGLLDSLLGPQIPAIDVVTLKAKKEAGKVPILVDVRNPDEYASGHVPDAVLMPLPNFGSFLGQLEAYKGQEIHVICRSGARSANACGTLIQAGHKAINISGGTLAWQAQGWPTVI